MQKKIIISLSSAIVFFVIILLLMGCNKSNSIKIDKDDLCIIEKNRITGNSFIRCYSKKLKSLKTINIEEKNLGSVDCKTKKSGQKVYILCNETKKKTVDSKFIMIDLKKGMYKTYLSNECINEMYVEDNVYTISSTYQSENISYIHKISKNLKSIFKLRIQNIVLTDIYVKENNIYVTGFDYKDKEVYSKLYVIDKKTMNIKKEIDISDYIVDVSDMLVVKDTLYIGGRTRRSKQKQEIDNVNLVSMDLKDYSFETRYVGDKIGQFLYKNKTLYFTNYDNVLDIGRRIYAMHMNTKNISSVSLTDDIRDMYIYNRKIYLIGKEYIYRCNNMKDIEGVRNKNKNYENVGFLRN
jgi:hypothetical protein